MMASISRQAFLVERKNRVAGYLILFQPPADAAIVGVLPSVLQGDFRGDLCICP